MTPSALGAADAKEGFPACSPQGTGEPFLLLGCLYPGSIVTPVVCDRLLHQTVTSDDLLSLSSEGLQASAGFSPNLLHPEEEKQYTPTQPCPAQGAQRCGPEFMLRIHLPSLGTKHSHKKMQLGESERDFIRSWVCGSPCNST